MNNPIKTAGVVAFTEDRKRVLLIKHSESAGHKTGVWGIPAGKVEKGENELMTAVRELAEEAGIEVEDLQELMPLPQTYSATIERKDGMKHYALNAFVYILQKDTQVSGSEEGEVYMIKVEEVKKLPLLPNVEIMITDALDLLKN